MKIWRVPYPKFGSGIGLHRVAAIAAELGIDLTRFGETGAVVVGSNGKGSTAAMLASILRQTGKSVGLFTSPHLFRLNERFAIDGADIDDAELESHWGRVAHAADAWCVAHDEQLGGFEFLFLIAADWFCARGCAFTVWEAGIGGRYDPTRLLRSRQGALTSLDLEHTELLGKTLEQIAYDKCDALPAGARLFVGESLAPLQEKIAAYCALRNVAMTIVKGVTSVAPPFAGMHQHDNAALAIALARSMVGELSAAQIASGLADTHWPGRLEIIEESPLIVIDVGHTPAAIRVALDGFEKIRGEKKSILVCGVSADKCANAIVGALAPAFPKIVCTAARHKGRPAKEIAAAAVHANGAAEIAIAETITEARRVALAKAHAGDAIYVAGGLFLAAEFKAVHQGVDPATLAFF